MDNPMSTILINGIDGLLGARVAQMLSADTTLRLIGLGRGTPIAPVGRAEVVTATFDGPHLVELLRNAEVDALIHLDFVGEETPASHRETAVQRNLLGSMELLGACTYAEVRRIVVRSSSLVYGAAPNHAAFITETQPLARPRHASLLRDYVEVEGFAADFASKRPDLPVVVLRCAGLVGGGVWSPLARYLSQSNPPTLLGFDPRIQVLHVDDAALGFALAATSTVTGCFNLAADPPVKLHQAIRLAGHQPMALFEPVADAAAALGLSRELPGGWPFERDFLRYACVADTRYTQAKLGWIPQHSTETILRELREADAAYTQRAQAEVALDAFLSQRSNA